MLSNREKTKSPANGAAGLISGTSGRGRLLAAVIVVVAVFLVPDVRQAAFGQSETGSDDSYKLVVVLPFECVGERGPGQNYCDGLMGLLSGRLTRFEKFDGSLQVIPSGDVRRRGLASAEQARKMLGANLAISGSVQQNDSTLQVTLGLVDAESQRPLRSTAIECPTSNLIALQDSSVQTLAEMLEINLQPAEAEMLRRCGTKEPNAYDHYLSALGYLCHREIAANIDTAILLLEYARELDSQFVEAEALLGEAYWLKYEFVSEPEFEELAIRYSREALKRNGKAAPVCVTLGTIYNGTGKYEQAVEVLRKAISSDPSTPRVYVELSKSYEALDRLDSAEMVLQEAIARRANDWSGYTRLGLFHYRHGRREDALLQLGRAVAVLPEGYDAWNNIGGLYFQLNKPNKAREMWERSIAIQPNFGALSNLGAVAFITGDFEQAAKSYRRALDLSDSDYRLWFNYAGALAEFAPDRADDAYARGLELAEARRRINPRDSELLAQMADAYASSGNNGKAISLIERALNLDPQNVDLKVTAGCVYELCGKREKAAQSIGIALEHGLAIDYLEALPVLDSLLRDSRFDRYRTGPEPAPSDSI